MDPSERPAERRDIEQLLGTFAARAPRVDRDRLMFLAGRAAAESEARQNASELSERTSAISASNSQAPQVATAVDAQADAQADATVECVLRSGAPTLAPRTPWYWPASTLASTSVALILAVTLITRDERSANRPDTAARSNSSPAASTDDSSNAGRAASSEAGDSPRAERPGEFAPPLVAQRETPVDSRLSSSDAQAIRWRELALREGVDALPIAAETASNSNSPLSYGSALQSLSQRPWSWIWDAN